MSTFLEMLESASRATGTLSVISRVGRERTTWCELFHQASRTARALRRAGLTAGDTAALAGPTCLETLQLLVAVWLCECSVAVLPPPQFRDSWSRRLETIEPSLFLVHGQYWPAVGGEFGA